MGANSSDDRLASAKALWVGVLFCFGIVSFAPNPSLGALSSIFQPCLKRCLKRQQMARIFQVCEHIQDGNEIPDDLISLIENLNLPCDIIEMTPLNFAISLGEYKSALKLLRAGADPNVTHPTHLTPLFLALWKFSFVQDFSHPGLEGVIQELVEKGAALVQHKESREFHALDEAVSSSNPAVIHMIVQAGADPKTYRAAGGRTALMMAAEFGTRENVEALIMLGGPDLLSATDDQGNSALSYAIKGSSNNLPVVQVLIDAGVDLDHYNVDWKLPIDLAESSGDPELTNAIRTGAVNRFIGFLSANRSDKTEFYTVETPAEAADQVDDGIEKGDRLPERRQHVDGVKTTAEEDQGRDDEQWHELQLLETVGPDAENEAEEAEGHGREHEEREHPQRVRDL